MAELLNSLLSPINLLIARGNNWWPRIPNHESSMFWSYSPPTMNKTSQKMLKLQITYFDWQPFLIFQDGCHVEDPIWLPMLPATFIAIWRFPKFWVFRCLVCSPPPCMLPYTLITVYGSCTWLTCMRTAPHHLPKKWPKNRPSTT